MNTHADKTQVNKNQSVKNAVSQKHCKGESTFQFADIRSETLAQRKLNEMLNNSFSVSQLRAFQVLSNKSQKTKKSTQVKSLSDNYPNQQRQLRKGENMSVKSEELQSNSISQSVDRVVIQPMFEFKNVEYYKGAVKKGTEAYRILSKHLGYVEAGAALAESDKEEKFKTENNLIDYLRKHYQDVIEKIISKQGNEDEEYKDLLMFLGGEQMKPKGWGHTFSNGKHGEDMALNEGALAIARATKEKKPAVGVWVNNLSAMKLIETSFARVGGEDASYFENLFGMPQSIGVAFLQDGKKVGCDGFFIKIQDGIIISAYPARVGDIPQGSLTRKN